jgi:hypothetical protein
MRDLPDFAKKSAKQLSGLMVLFLAYHFDK